MSTNLGTLERWYPHFRLRRSGLWRYPDRAAGYITRTKIQYHDSAVSRRARPAARPSSLASVSSLEHEAPNEIMMLML